MKPILVIYHANCLDGFGAALSANMVFRDTATYLPVSYGDAVPDVAGKDVFILDFCYPPEVITAMEASAKSVTVLDHHKSHRDKFVGYTCRCGNRVHFDLGKSGARLAWEHFHPAEPVPALIQSIEDRDLWNWKLPNTAEVTNVMDIAPRTFEHWEEVLNYDVVEQHALVLKGSHMREQFMSQCEEIACGALPITINGVQGLSINASAAFASEVGGMLAARSGTFGLVWYLKSATSVKCSLRAVAPYSISEMAETFGGGGHAQASGFLLPATRLSDIANGVLNAV